MPWKKKSAAAKGKKRTYTKKKKYSKRKNFTKASRKTIKGLGTIVPDRMFMKMKYVMDLDFTPSISSSGDAWVFHGNGVYDPDNTGVGTTVMGYPKMITLFNFNRVHASKITVNMVAVSGSHIPMQIAVVPINDSPVSISSTNQAAMRPYARSAITVGYGGPYTTIRDYMSTKKIFGLKTIDQTIAAPTNSLPAVLWYWYISGTTLTGGNIAGTYGRVEITYYVEWFDRIDNMAVS